MSRLKKPPRREVAEETGIDARAPGCLLTDWALENVYDIWAAMAAPIRPGGRAQSRAGVWLVCASSYARGTGVLVNTMRTSGYPGRSLRIPVSPLLTRKPACCCPGWFRRTGISSSDGAAGAMALRGRTGRPNLVPGCLVVAGECVWVRRRCCVRG